MPQTEADISAMLAVVGKKKLEDLIAHLPENLRKTAAIGIEPGRAEAELIGEISALAARNRDATSFTSFLGAGYYRHFIPAAVRAVTARAEFSTSYTPYQAEASQGTTQAIFEFQTLIAQLTGLEVANASMYDGASAAAEAVLMARRLLPKRRIVALSRALWPDYRDTIRTYLSALDDVEIVDLPFDDASGAADFGALEKIADDRLLCVVAGYPNAFGIIEPLVEIANTVRRNGALTISVTTEALALGLLRAPGELGVDIAVGEGQSFGLPLQFGGPGVGFFAARMANIRQMPGRLVGQSVDREGRRAFTLTLATREQHIRRERATSNICTNHSLCALAATVYLSLMGRQGLRELAERNVESAHSAAEALRCAGIKRRFSGQFFNEFAIVAKNPQATLEAAERHGIIAGTPLWPAEPTVPNALLMAVTEMNRTGDVDVLTAAI
ncbi:MAG TPA: aminomethyl-transferring glycine dehydrogenase subunit GcvPA, partial [Candidatus Binataceae bacterium]|nr:aminomethyl-transferring glycine dehydrogenase subunit GcvPA [Candidatus Binataceae bacterium]